MTRYHPILVTLHWLLALMIIGALIVGWTVLSAMPNDDPAKTGFLAIHMGSGLAVLALMLVRLAVRLFTKAPPHADIGHPLLNRVGVAMHWLLYLAVIGLAASGMALSMQAGLPPIVFGGSGEALPADFSVFGPRAAHGALATLVGLLLLGHIGAALYHQLVRRDGLFARMWYGEREG